MVSARPHILIKVAFLKHFALEVWVSIVMFCDDVFHRVRVVTELCFLALNKIDWVI